MTTILHFTASWAEGVCAPHRHEVKEAASALGCQVVELDVDQHPEDARDYRVLNVPAVAVEGHQDRLPIVGARAAAEIVKLLSGVV